MARRIESDLSPEGRRREGCPAEASDGGERVSIHRTRNGAIDFDYYERLSRSLRNRCIRLWLRWVIDRVARFWRHRTMEAELYRLDERTLHDIGINRGDIPAIASGVYCQDESRIQRGTPDKRAGLF